MAFYESHFSAAASHSDSVFGGDVTVIAGAKKTVHSDTTVYAETTERRKNRDGGFDLLTSRYACFLTRLPTNARVFIGDTEYGIELIEEASDGRFYTKLVRVAIAEISKQAYRR